MAFDELRDAEKICVLQEQCHQIPSSSICDDDEDCFEASGQNDVETTTMFTSIKQLTEITRNEYFTKSIFKTRNTFFMAQK